MKDKSMTGAFVQASFRSSAAVMGLAFISNLYGPSAMGPLMIIGAVPLYNIYSVLVLTFEAEGEEQDRDTGKLKEACVNILKNPIILSIALGLAVSLLRLDFPVLIDKTINNVASMATPLALITLGAGFEGKKALAKIKPTLVAAFIKLVAQAAVFIPVAIHFGFTGEKLIAIMVMLAAPATPSCYIMAKSMKNDDVLTASIIVANTHLPGNSLSKNPSSSFLLSLYDATVNSLSKELVSKLSISLLSVISASRSKCLSLFKVKPFFLKNISFPSSGSGIPEKKLLKSCPT